MTFQDILKKSFLEQFTLNDLQTSTIVVVLGITTILAIYMYFFYRFANRNNFYSKQLNVSLPVLAIITASIILTISSNIVVSLGMVGALSIVRFRTAVKAPLDLVFLFWSISIGIMCGASQFELAIIGSALVSLLIFVLEQMPNSKSPMLLVVQAGNIAIEEEMVQLLRKYTSVYKIKSRSIAKEKLNMIVELKAKNGDVLIGEMNKLKGIDHLSLMSHEGEITY